MLHATMSVSTEFEKVCVWYVHVTYEDATSRTAMRRWRGEWMSSWMAQSSRTKLMTNMRTRRVQKTAMGGISPGWPRPIQSHCRSSMGSP